MPMTGKRKTTRAHRIFAPGVRFDLKISTADALAAGGWVRDRDRGTRTPSNDVEHQDNEPKDASASRALPAHAALGSDRGGFCEHAERELEECCKGELEHGGGG